MTNIFFFNVRKRQKIFKNHLGHYKIRIFEERRKNVEKKLKDKNYWTKETSLQDTQENKQIDYALKEMNSNVKNIKIFMIK